MLIDIKPISTLAISVREDIIAAVLSWLGRDYMPMLIEFWGFGFRPEDPKLPGKLGNRVDLDKGNLVKPLEMFYGIKLETRAEQRDTELLAIIEAELHKNHPVILNMQTMYLPYHRTYQKPEESHPHQILVTGMDESKIYWIDPACSKNVESIALEEFTPGMISAETFVITDQKAEDWDWRQVVRAIVQKVRTPKNGHKDIFEAIRDFANKIETSLDITVETDGCEFDMESLRFNQFIFKIDQLSRSRNTIAKVFDYLAEKNDFPALRTIAESFRLIAQEWVRLRYIIIKGVTTPSDETSIMRAVEKIKKLADKEEEMAVILERWCDNDTEFYHSSVDLG
ncbi:MAG TPA: BtrH N-terminal domain-containing protein, partial [Bacillota bacterium]|nr:BtrH N-terminal domain-containing protein [Bacillota bacterium]